MASDEKRVAMIFDLQNIIEYLREQKKDPNIYVPYFVFAIRRISKKYGEPETPQLVVSSDLPNPIVDHARKIALMIKEEDQKDDLKKKKKKQIKAVCTLSVAPVQAPGKEDVVDEVIKERIRDAVNDERVSTILLVSGDLKHFRSPIRYATRKNKNARQITPKKMLEILGKGDTAEKINAHLQEEIESIKDPFPNILLRLQRNEPILPEEKEGLEFLNLVEKAILDLYQKENLIPFSKLLNKIWEKVLPNVKQKDREGQKFNYYHCQDALLAFLDYSDLLHQDQEGVRLRRG